jgi:predicted enzyme related to lactoylglutathione lyase
MPIKIKEVAFICHPVTDIARAREFYGKTLGLKTGLEIEFQPGMWWIEFDVAGVALAVTNSFPPEGGSGASLALEVADLDETIEAVKAAGFALKVEPMEFPVCRVFAINSPDGHTIMFHQKKA